VLWVSYVASTLSLSWKLQGKQHMRQSTFLPVILQVFSYFKVFIIIFLLPNNREVIAESE